MLADAGIDKRIVQAILGHKGGDVTDRVYTHISIDVMRDALNQI
jgi:site-specific recombinase XerD